MNKKLLGYICLAQKSGNLLSGEFACENAVKSKTAKLVLLACDASDNTKKKFMDKSSFYNIDIVVSDIAKIQLGSLIGKQMRSVIVVIDENMACNILGLFKE